MKNIFKFKENNKFVWALIILALAVGFLDFIIMPLWNNTEVFFAGYGNILVRIILAIGLIFYMIKFVLIRAIKNSSKAFKIVHIIEFSLLVVLLAGIILPIFNIRITNITDPCLLIGVVLWLRGSTEVFDAYYYDKSIENKYPLYKVFLTIILITLGVIMIIKNFITTIIFQWILFVLLFVLFVYLIIDIIYGWPEKKVK